MKWDKGFSCLFYCGIVDLNTWRDIGRFDITGGTVKKTISNLKQSADIECTNYDNSVERYIRIWMDVRQDNSAQHIPLFTGLAQCPDSDHNGILTENTIACYSVLKPAEDINLQRGWYAPAGISGALLVKDLLSVIHAPIQWEENSPALKQAIIAEDNENRLSMSIKILEAINWRLMILGNGTVIIQPPAKSISAYYNPIDNDMIETEIKESYDFYSCPNVLRAIMDDLTAVARDDSQNSPFSTVSRGREIWYTETDCSVGEQESIEEYSVRRLKELQRPARSFSYNRSFDPNVDVTDLIRLHYPQKNIEGIFMVQQQSIDFEDGVTVSEEVVQI